MGSLTAGGIAAIAPQGEDKDKSMRHRSTIAFLMTLPLIVLIATLVAIRRSCRHLHGDAPTRARRGSS